MITQDDIIYFTLTDRFYDKDIANDEIEKKKVNKSNPNSYHGGDFLGIIEKIPYLKDLGITTLWISPVYLSIGRYGDTDGYHGYWAMDFEKVDPLLYTKDPSLTEGSKQYLKKLVDELHKNGIKLILDMVVNHTGYHTEEYNSYQNKRIDNDWFNKGGNGEKKEQLAGLPDLDHDKADVRDYFVNNILDWINETGIDGIRMDTVKHVEDNFWYYFKSYVRGKHRNITLIGEVLELDNIAKISMYQTKHDFDALFDFPLNTTLKNVFIHGASMNSLAKPRLSEVEPLGILDKDTNFYSNANRLVTLLDNHDLNSRIKTEILDKWGHWDKIRSNKILKLCLSFLLTTRGIPQIYYGTEIGMEGYKDPDNRRDMNWDIFKQTSSTVTDEQKYAFEIYEHAKQLIKIRKENESIPFGYLFTLYSDYFIYAYMREFKGNTIIVVLNNGLDKMPIPLTIDIGSNSNIPSRIKSDLEGITLTNLLDTEDTIKCTNGRIDVQLEGKEAKIYKANVSSIN